MPERMQASLSLEQQQQMQMILAPHLRQSLEILQMPIMELRQFILKELQQNPTLEEKQPRTESIEIEEPEQAGPDFGEKELNFNKEFEALSAMDEEWRDYLAQAYEWSGGHDEEREKKRNFFMDSLVQRPSLQEHLLRQLELSELNEDDGKIGEMLIGNINNDGYLAQSLEEISASTGLEQERLQDILSVIQNFDPIGVGARNLQECLSIQLERLGHADSTAYALVNGHLEQVAAKQFKEAAKELHVPPEEISKAARLVATLDPRPGLKYSAEAAPYITPDVTVYKTERGFAAALNNEQIPRLRISRQYRRLMADEKAPPDVYEYIKERIRSGLFVIKSIAHRQDTMLKVANEIVRVQSEFMEKGVSGMKPLTMAEVAAAVGVHETTVSRCLSGKYIRTPRGLFEMKYFFSPGLKTADGVEISTKTIKDMIRDLVKAEPSVSPVSDQEIRERLKAQGINVARRTIAKYRVEMKIPSSRQRKFF